MTDNRNVVLELRDLTLRRGDFLLDGVSFDVKEKEIFAIIGKTGAGKTLLLEAASGLCKADGGEALFRGTPIRNIPVHQRNIGYLYQDYGLFPHMSAQENIGFSLRMQRVAAKERQRRVEEMAERFGIREVLEQYPATLSGGEQQRVALARALMMRPPVLFLDEPFSALDPVTRQDFYRMIHEIREEFGCAILFVTHDFSEAQQLADRIGVLIDGRLRGIVAAQSLFDAPWEPEVCRFLGISRKQEGEKE